MPVKFLLLINLLFWIGIPLDNKQSDSAVKAWIEIEGEVQNISISAKLQNLSDQTIAVDYILKTKKEGRSGNSNMIQRGKCISQSQKTISLSESRMNLTRKDDLMISLMIYHNNKLIAQDSVVFHGDNR